MGLINKIKVLVVFTVVLLLVVFITIIWHCLWHNSNLPPPKNQQFTTMLGLICSSTSYLKEQQSIYTLQICKLYLQWNCYRTFFTSHWWLTVIRKLLSIMLNFYPHVPARARNDWQKYYFLLTSFVIFQTNKREQWSHKRRSWSRTKSKSVSHHNSTMSRSIYTNLTPSKLIARIWNIFKVENLFYSSIKGHLGFTFLDLDTVIDFSRLA